MLFFSCLRNLGSGHGCIFLLALMEFSAEFSALSYDLLFFRVIWKDLRALVVLEGKC